MISKKQIITKTPNIVWSESEKELIRKKVDLKNLYSYSLLKVEWHVYIWATSWEKSKKISNDQELIQLDPISCRQNQKGNN